jgi:hypothetical protein
MIRRGVDEWSEMEVTALLGISNDFLYDKLSGMKRPFLLYGVIHPDEPV